MSEVEVTDIPCLTDTSDVEVRLAPVPDTGPLPIPWEGDAHVYWQDQDRLLRIKEVEDVDEIAGPYRHFTLNGGFPTDWLRNEVTDAILIELGNHMFNIPQWYR